MHPTNQELPHNQAPIVTLVRAIINQAAAERATEICIEYLQHDKSVPQHPQRNAIRVLYRRAGAELEATVVPDDLADPLARRLGVIANDSAESCTSNKYGGFTFKVTLPRETEQFPITISLSPVSQPAEAAFAVADQAITDCEHKRGITRTPNAVLREYRPPIDPESKTLSPAWNQLPIPVREFVEKHQNGNNPRNFARIYDTHTIIAQIDDDANGGPMLIALAIFDL